MTLQIETNVDDMDPRLWPTIIEKLLDAGALDAWVTPIVMKKGRPAFTLSALCEDGVAEAVRASIFRETTTIGMREFPVQRHVLTREESVVDVHGQSVGVKRAYDAGVLMNTSVEWEDVLVAAANLNLAPKQVLAIATAAATLH